LKADFITTSTFPAPTATFAKCAGIKHLLRPCWGIRV
jgi:hypothetical protein